MPKPAEVSCIYVLAGTNGAGKSSVGGAAFRERGADYFNPDEAARAIRDKNPGITIEEANSAAWFEGKRLLGRAIRDLISHLRQRSEATPVRRQDFWCADDSYFSLPSFTLHS